MKEKGTAMFDVDGTITKEGEFSPKALAIPKLEKILSDAIYFLVHAGCSDEAAAKGALEAWTKNRGELLKNPEYYGRFFSSEEEVVRADKPLQDLVVFEAIKEISPEFSKNLTSLMITGMVTGALKVFPYNDAVDSILGLAEDDYKIATYGGGSAPVQRVQLSRVPIEAKIGGKKYRNIAEIIEDGTTGAGLHSKEDFGKKTKKESYIFAAEYFAERGIPLQLWITDSIKEADACREAAEVKKFRCNSIYVNRIGTDQKTVEQLRANGIVVVNKLDYSQIKCKNLPSSPSSARRNSL